MLEMLGILSKKLPLLWTLSGWLAALGVMVAFSFGLLMTFAGKYKRGFHDLLARSIVADDIITERGKASGSKN